MNDPLVSIVIPAYNSAEFIDRCLDSIVAQTYQNWETFVVIAPSKDNTVEKANAQNLKDKRITVVCEETKTSCATARNNGFSRCTGKYVLFLDSDDWIEPTRIEKQVATFEGTKNQWVWGYVRSVSLDGTSTVNMVAPTDLHDSLLGILSIMFRKIYLDSLKEQYGFVFDPSLPWFDDVDLFLKIRGLPNGHVSEVVTNYYLNWCGLTQTTHPLGRELMMFKILIRNRAWEYFPKETKEAIASIGSKAVGVDLVRWKKGLVSRFNKELMFK
jgi:glycosyltransferase involved in cell wall biosynthesis